MDAIESNLTDFARSLPDFAREIEALEATIAGKSIPDALVGIRRIAEHVLKEAFPDEDGLRASMATEILNTLIECLNKRNALPANIKTHADTIRLNTNQGAHHQHNPVEDPHLQIALISLGEMLRWLELIRLGHTAEQPSLSASAPRPKEYLALIEQYSSSGDLLYALQFAEKGVEIWPDNPDFRKSKIQLLRRFGASQQAHEEALTWNRENPTLFDATLCLAELEIETLRTCPPRDEEEREEAIEDAIGRVQRMLREVSSHANPTMSMKLSASRCALDVATVCSKAGEEKRAKDLAADTATILERIQPNPDSVQHDQVSVLLGETAAIQGDLETAQEHFAKATGAIEKDWRACLEFAGATRRNLVALGFNKESDLKKKETLQALVVPSVVAFTGHMMDKWDRAEPRFPKEREEEVTRDIADELNRQNARIGVASGTCGGDIIFLEQIRDLGGEIHMVLPYSMDRFIEDTLTIDSKRVEGYQFNGGKGGKGPWEVRFRKLWDFAKTTTILSEQCSWDNAMASECCNRNTLGLALLKAQAHGARPSLLALWDGQPGDAYGGTQSMVDFASERKGEMGFVHLKTLASEPAAPKPATDPKREQRICAVLLVKVDRFDRIPESDLPTWVNSYLSLLARMIEKATKESSDLLEYNSWGDGLFCVFSSMASAGRFALTLQSKVNKKNWQRAGLPADYNIRISLHAGPVYEIEEPILKRPSYIGSHVNYGFRMGTRTPVGHIYTSQSFAALAAAEGVTEFACEYVEQIRLEGQPGSHPVYVLRG